MSIESPHWHGCTASAQPEGDLWRLSNDDDDTIALLKPRYRAGDTLWVRETWRMAQWDGPIYRADKERSMGMDEYSDRHKWRPSIYMPRWASRITLRVVGVRVERVQDISYEDAVAEGCGYPNRREPECEGETWEQTARRLRWPQRTYEKLWDSLNAARGYGWDANPWVWVVQFARI